MAYRSLMDELCMLRRENLSLRQLKQDKENMPAVLKGAEFVDRTATSFYDSQVNS